MKLFRIAVKDQEWLATKPETCMGVQILRAADQFSDDILFVIGGQVGLWGKDMFLDGEQAVHIDEAPWSSNTTQFDAPVDAVGQFRNWLDNLEELPEKAEGATIMTRSAFQLFPLSPLPPPSSGGVVYGHLPFAGRSGTQDVVYRWEPWPVSRRINQRAGTIAPDTFTAPMSEIPFMPTGFSAVARLALPSLLPACYRWELRPPPDTSLRCGASVPMFGQSGGGVEIAFPHGFVNVGPIANPVILPAL